MRTRVLTLLAAATVAVAAPATASAATVIGGFSAGLSKVKSDTNSVASGSAFSSSGGVVLDSSGDLSSAVGLFNSWNFTAANGKTVGFEGSFGSFVGTITSVLSGTNVLSVYALGTFTPTAPGFDAGKASVLYTFNQVGGTGSVISGSFSFASPPSGVPEPATWGMMIAGAAMAGAAVRRRRASTKVAAA